MDDSIMQKTHSLFAFKCVALPFNIENENGVKMRLSWSSNVAFRTSHQLLGFLFILLWQNRCLGLVL